MHTALMGGAAYFFINSSHFNAELESLQIGLSIFLYYNISRIIRVRDYYAIQSNLHLQWVSKNLTELFFTIGFSLIFILLIGNKTDSNLENIGWLLLISVLYIFLRERPFLKNLLIAKAWCLAFGVFHSESNYLFAYFLSLSLWYDFKDDRDIDYSKVIIMLITLGVAGMIFFDHFSLTIFQLAIFTLIHLLMIFTSLKVKKEFFYLLIVDWMIFLSGLAIYCKELIYK